MKVISIVRENPNILDQEEEKDPEAYALESQI